MSGLTRYTQILRLFGETRSEWTVQDISTALGVPASTIYRIVRELVSENLLEPSTEAHYRLGSAFVEFDRLVRLTDPFYQAGTSLLRDVALQARIPCTAILARLYRETVMCVADAAGPGGAVPTSYERGRPMPLTSGATSKVILAQLPARRLSKLLDTAEAPGRHPFAQSEKELREEHAAIRRRGYCVARGEVDKGLAGLAAPVSLPEHALLASLSLVVDAATLDSATERRLVLLIVSSASLLSEALVQHHAEMAMQARAV